ncbi:MAG: type II toxin-antitoxin system MqsR family toxin [Magnetococcales bacterium]|nr:type II toxin-antitoxin system MqsR family toxin [Magnetococcales bacterium]
MKTIKAAFQCGETMNSTTSAIDGAELLGMFVTDMVKVIQSLTSKNFYKSMTFMWNNKLWQDVYYVDWQGVSLYIKFTLDHDGDLLLISFKEK